MWTLLGIINKNLIVAIPVMMVFGFIFGITFQAAFLKSLIIPFTFLMVYPMMVTLKIKKVFEGGDIKAQVLTQCINFGIIPLNFKNEKNYGGIDQGDELEIPNIKKRLKDGEKIIVENKTKGTEFEVTYDLSERQKMILLAGGTLAYMKKQAK